MGDKENHASASRYAYRPRGLAGKTGIDRHPVVVVGAGPVGLSVALDLARRGVPVLLLDEDDKLSTGSRAICFAKRTLEIWDRLGVGQRMHDQGVSWKVGRIFLGDEEVWRFDLLPESGHRRPAFINLQQYHVEDYLVQAMSDEPRVELRWQSKVVAMTQDDEGARLTVETPEGPYHVDADWVVACDGSRSPLRGMLGQSSQGRMFRDRFLIADIRMQAPFPPERWFWFDPPFHPGQSVLLHRQPGDMWRVDFQLGWDADPKEAVKPENVLPMLRALLGKDAGFELEWVSVYTFACERMAHFRHGHVLFAGDSAHRVSPFGARGANSGVQDADNLAWKLQRVVQGLASERLLDSYSQEREAAADENIRHSSRSTDFISPKSEISRVFRNAVLKLAREHPFARTLVNSGRLSSPSVYGDSSLNTPDGEAFPDAARPGSCALDAPIERMGVRQWWLDELDGRFVLAVFCHRGAPAAAELQWLRMLDAEPLGAHVVLVRSAGHAEEDHGLHSVIDSDGLMAQRYDMRGGGAYLIRPDQHVAARWRTLDEAGVRAALARASCSLAQEAAWLH